MKYLVIALVLSGTQAMAQGYLAPASGGCKAAESPVLHVGTNITLDTGCAR